MFSCSGYSVNRKWCSEISRLSNDIPMPTDLQDYFQQLCGSHFCGWLLNHMMNIGSNGRRQMFYITFILHYFGLSREGINILSKYGYGVTLDMFDDLRRSYRAGSTEMTR